MDENVDTTKKKSIGRSSLSKKNGAKVHRKIHKAEREKLKRDYMNDLFLELTKALEPTNQNNGKSSALTDTIRILRDLIAQVESLKKENSVLLAESQYVAIEKNELKEENVAMEAQIKRLQSQIDQAAGQVVGPVFVVPIQNDPKLYTEPKIGSNVSKPHARYPLPSDSWPFNILSEQGRTD
ncbi:transcription factor bHLH47 [Lactuca sativa]|uniref:transcription factor bHLH47 n=1 Tax=Lactuca sativa TaxID=4236 RepID=UPI000CB452D4|nr:transcription factor bHLH47 [Lactuca sativa]XP_023758364.1 transcription factor bHLH47 [Lactuca sativa]